MKASSPVEAPRTAVSGAARWLLFVHQLPSSPSNLRVRTWRRLQQIGALPVRQAAWYRKSLPTFVDAIAIGRRHLWTSTHFYMSPVKADMVEIPCTLLNRLTDTLCYAA